MKDGDVLTDADLYKFARQLDRGEHLEQIQMHRIMKALHIQRRVLKYLFSLFQKVDDSGLRYVPHSIRHHNLAQLKRDVGLDDTEL